MKSNEFLKRIVGVVCGFCVSACMLSGLAANAAPNPLLGVQPGYPDIFYISGSGQGCTYSSGSPGTRTIPSQPQYVTFTDGGTPQFITGGLLTITAKIDASGTIYSGTFIVSGVVGANGRQLWRGLGLRRRQGRHWSNSCCWRRVGYRHDRLLEKSRERLARDLAHAR